MNLFIQSTGRNNLLVIVKKKQRGVVPLSKNSFAKLFNNWYNKNSKDTFNSLESEKESQEDQERVSINAVRLMSVEARLDLHGYTSYEAGLMTSDFLKEQYYLDRKKVEIVTGKGLHSKGGVPVIRDSVISAIRSLDFIREYYSPSERYGGSGTIHIIFKDNK